MEDIAYFRSTIAPEAADGPVGWTVAESLRAALQGAAMRTSVVKPSWDGVQFSCILRYCHFDVVFTPYFEARPVEWSIEVRRRGLAGRLPMVWQPAQASLVENVKRWLNSDERVTLIRWESLAELAAQRRRTASG